MDLDQTNSTLPTPTDEEKTLALAAELAAANLLFAQQELGMRIVDPTITTKGLLDIAEHSYKVSGMAKKQEAKDDGGRVVFNINFSGGKTLTLEKDVGGSSADTTPQTLAFDAANLLALDVSFDDAPEFR